MGLLKRWLSYNEVLRLAPISLTGDKRRLDIDNGSTSLRYRKKVSQFRKKASDETIPAEIPLSGGSNLWDLNISGLLATHCGPVLITESD